MKNTRRELFNGDRSYRSLKNLKVPLSNIRIRSKALLWRGLHEQKFVHVLRYVVAQDLEEGFSYFEGLVIDQGEDTPEEVAAGIGAVTASIRKEI